MGEAKQRHRLTIRSLMIVVVVFALLFAIARDPYFGFALLLVALSLSLLGGLLYAFLKLPRWFRWPAEFVAVVLLLFLHVLSWSPPYLLGDAVTCEALARQARKLVPGSPDPPAMRAEAEWFERRAAALRWSAFWIGFRQGPPARPDVPDTGEKFTEDLVTDIRINEHRDRMWRLSGMTRPVEWSIP